jgi:WD40 repeat protein
VGRNWGVSYSGIRTSGGWDGNILIWDIDNQSLIKSINGHSEKIYSVFFTQEYLISGGNDKTIKIWD